MGSRSGVGDHRHARYDGVCGIQPGFRYGFTGLIFTGRDRALALLLIVENQFSVPWMCSDLAMSGRSRGACKRFSGFEEYCEEPHDPQK